MAPTTPCAATPFAEAIAAYHGMLTQLASLRALLELRSLGGIVDFVEGFGAAQPMLPVRCVAVVVLFGNDANESFLYGPSIQQRVLQQLAEEYGSPLYRRLADGDEALLDGVLRYRVHRTMDPTKATAELLAQMRQQTLEILRHWATEAGKCFLVHLETMLCNRGLAHQRLLGALAGLAKFQELSYSTDITFFMGTQPGVAPAAGLEAISLSTVLTLFANSYVLRTMELILQFQIELDLLSQGEVIPALWYVNFIQRAQIENFALLYLQNTSKIPAQRINKKTRVPLYNLALTTRTTGAPDVVRLNLLGASRMLSDAVFLAACLMEGKGLIDLTSGAPHGLISAENTFNHRMLECFGQIHSPPLASYKRCTSAKPELTGELASRLPLYARKASEAAEGAAGKAKAMLSLRSGHGVERERLNALRGAVEGFERAANHTAASLRAFTEICEDPEKLAQRVAVVERPVVPYLLNFGLQEKA
ncbi:unnamed protein product [Phytomonas sp. EM1]|nr:unnamed protein product [Phytomonas sp. EM1]|eukprot:CCW63914.1 unnamed protein product [Phytomonas sp. isolate EM1]